MDNESNQAPEAVTFTQKPVLLIVAGGLVFVSLLVYGYYLTQANYFTDQNDQVDLEIVSINKQIDDLESEERVSAQKGLDALTKIEAVEIPWSQVISDVDQLIPIDTIKVQPKVEFISFSGDRTGTLTLNGQTPPSGNFEKQVKAVTETLGKFNGSPVFDGVFIPTITKGFTQDDELVLSFVFNSKYSPLLAGASDTEDEPTPEEEEVSVPRR